MDNTTNLDPAPFDPSMLDLSALFTHIPAIVGIVIVLGMLITMASVFVKR